MDDENTLKIQEWVNVLSEISHTLMGCHETYRQSSESLNETLNNQNIILEEINNNLQNLVENSQKEV